MIGIFINDKYIKNKKLDSLKMKLISRMGYNEYSEVDSKFFMNRPKWKV